MPIDPETGEWVDTLTPDPVAKAVDPKIAAYRQHWLDQKKPVTLPNRAGAFANGIAENARLKAESDASPVGAFQNRLSAMQRSHTRAPDTVYDRSVDQGAASGTDAGGSDVASMRAAMMSPGEFATQIPNRNAGRVAIMGNEAMLPGQRSAIGRMAMNDAGDREPLRGTVNGQSFSMPASGPRVTADKAKSYLALAEQARQQDLRESMLREQQRLAEDARKEALRVKMRNEGIEDTNNATKQMRDDAEYQRTQQEFERQRKFNEENDKFTLKNNAGRLTDTQKADVDKIDRALESPKLTAYKKISLQKRRDAITGGGSGIPDDVLTDLYSDDPSAVEAKVSESVNSTTVTPAIDDMKNEVKRLHASRGVFDNGDQSVLEGVGNALISAPRALLTNRSLMNGGTDKLEAMYDRAVADARSRNPELPENKLRSMIARQVMAVLPEGNTAMSQAIREMLTRKMGGPSAPSFDPSLRGLTDVGLSGPKRSSSGPL
jgi:hypothetical protein